MTTERNSVAEVELYTNRPTDLTLDQLYTWTVWQFPRKKEGGLCGAVRPPIAKHHWLPAIIKTKEKRVRIYGHLTQSFSSPESALEYLTNHEGQETK